MCCHTLEICEIFTLEPDVPPLCVLQLEETDETAKAVRAEPFGEDAQHSRYFSFSSDQQDCWVFK